MREKKPRAHPPYTPAEDAIIIEHYRLRGSRHVAKRIGRSIISVQRRARFLPLDDGIPAGRMSIPEAASILGVSTSATRQRAKYAGVLKGHGYRRAGGGARRLLTVPIDWPDETRRAVLDARDGAILREQGYVTIHMLAARANVPITVMWRHFHGHRPALGLFTGIRHVQGMLREILFHPIDALTVRKRIQAERDRIRALVSTKTLVVELAPLSHAYVHRVINGLGIKRTRNRLGGNATYITPEDADKVQEHITGRTRPHRRAA